jgi:hypothetical protein
MMRISYHKLGGSDVYERIEIQSSQLVSTYTERSEVLSSTSQNTRRFPISPQLSDRNTQLVVSSFTLPGLVLFKLSIACTYLV